MDDVAHVREPDHSHSTLSYPCRPCHSTANDTIVSINNVNVNNNNNAYHYHHNFNNNTTNTSLIMDNIKHK